MLKEMLMGTKDAEKLIKRIEQVRSDRPTLEERLESYRQRRKAYSAFREGQPKTSELSRRSHL